jgi:hypothetical protein
VDRAAFAFGGYTLDLEQATIVAWVACLAFGGISHLLSDACTYAGISPFLPFATARMWLLPRILRSRSDGYLDAPEDQERLFVPYFTRKKTGTGLGLAIVRRIITDHEGQIHVGNNHPKGAVFTFDLPV